MRLLTVWTFGLSLAAMAAHPATEWAHEEFTNYTARLFGAAPKVAFVLPGETADFAADFAALPDGRIFSVTTPRLPDPGKASHGTGCTFSAALAAVLAQRQGWKTALAQAKSFVYGSLSEPAMIGKNLNAMYPPVEDYDRLVKIAELG